MYHVNELNYKYYKISSSIYTERYMDLRLNTNTFVLICDFDVNTDRW